jgi:glc operon protein GlcG
MSELITSKSPSLDQALEMLAGVRTAAEQEGIAVAAAVVDAGGHVIASQRMDGTALGAAVLANDKAYTALLWGVRTGDFMESTQPGGVDWAFPSTSGGRIVVYAGGVPLYRDGMLVGGIGASGGAAEQDEACVSAAARAAGFDISA